MRARATIAALVLARKLPIEVADEHRCGGGKDEINDEVLNAHKRLSEKRTDLINSH